MTLYVPMSFRLQESKLASGLFKVEGEAIHPMRTFHPDEYPTVRVYLEDELARAAESLSGKPFVLDHKQLLPEPNRVTKAWWNADRRTVAYEGELEEYYAHLIQEGIIKGVSIELRWDIPGGSIAFVDGYAAKGFKFEGLSLLHTLEAGDRNAFIKLAEAIFTNREHTQKSSSEPERKDPKTLEDYVRRTLGW